MVNDRKGRMIMVHPISLYKVEGREVLAVRYHINGWTVCDQTGNAYQVTKKK